MKTKKKLNTVTEQHVISLLKSNPVLQDEQSESDDDIVIQSFVGPVFDLDASSSMDVESSINFLFLIDNLLSLLT